MCTFPDPKHFQVVFCRSSSKKRHFPAVVGHALKALITFVAYGHVFYLLHMLGLMTTSMKSILSKKISKRMEFFYA
jgi:hypothetical protein